MSFTITPEVNTSQEFIEIAQDFSNPLDLVREGISNGFDAHAQNMQMSFDVVMEYGERVLKIIIQDDGDGMDEDGLGAGSVNHERDPGASVTRVEWP